MFQHPTVQLEPVQVSPGKRRDSIEPSTKEVSHYSWQWGLRCYKRWTGAPAICPWLLPGIWKPHSKCLRSGGDIILATFQAGNRTAKVQSVRVKALSRQDSPKCYEFHLFITTPWSTRIIKSLSRFSLETLVAESFLNPCNISLKAKPDSTAPDSLFITHKPAIASLALPSLRFPSFRELLKNSCSMKRSSSNYHMLLFSCLDGTCRYYFLL